MFRNAKKRSKTGKLLNYFNFSASTNLSFLIQLFQAFFFIYFIGGEAAMYAPLQHQTAKQMGLDVCNY
jgi:hypothetical protein